MIRRGLEGPLGPVHVWGLQFDWQDLTVPEWPPGPFAMLLFDRRSTHARGESPETRQADQAVRARCSHMIAHGPDSTWWDDVFDEASVMLEINEGEYRFVLTMWVDSFEEGLEISGAYRDEVGHILVLTDLPNPTTLVTALCNELSQPYVGHLHPAGSRTRLTCGISGWASCR